MSFNSNSTLMNFFLKIKLPRLAWAIRKLHTPVNSTDLVLEVGSGGNPYPRSNILLDAYESTRERHWAPLVTDRPTILGFVENLPFKDNTFDFVIASHVLEHSTDPAKFLSEIQRVGKAGYIEVPDAFMERINPYQDHRLEITVRDGTLLIFKKDDWVQDRRVVELYEDRVKSYMTTELMPKRPFQFHVRYYWEGKIDFKIINDDVDASWAAPKSDPRINHISMLGRLKGLVYNGLAYILTQSKRNSDIEVLPLLSCLECGNGDLSRLTGSLTCNSCHAVFQVKGSLIDMKKRTNSASDLT